MARANVRNAAKLEVPDEVGDELERAGFVAHPPRTVAEAKRVNRIVGRTIKDTLKPSDEIDGRARAAKRMAKAEQRESRGRRGLRSPDGDRRGDRIVGAKWRKGTGITAGRCLWPDCGLLVFSHTSLNVATEMHQSCMTAAMRNPAVRDWLSQRKRARDEGMKPHMIARRFGNHLPIPGAVDPNTDTTTKHLTWAVLTLLGGDSQTELARNYGVSQQAIGPAVERVLLLLPPRERVPEKYRPLVARLRSAEQRR
jgi:hypothetical protein